MPLGNGLNIRDDLDDRLREYVDNIRFLNGEVTQKNSEIRTSQETLDDLRSSGLITPELEQTFSSAVQKALDEKAELEKKKETIAQTARQELNEAEGEYDKAIDRLKTGSGGQVAEVLSAIRERLTELGDWERELQEALDDDDSNPPSGPIKRLVLKR